MDAGHVDGRIAAEAQRRPLVVREPHALRMRRSQQ